MARRCAKLFVGFVLLMVVTLLVISCDKALREAVSLTQTTVVGVDFQLFHRSPQKIIADDQKVEPDFLSELSSVNNSSTELEAVFEARRQRLSEACQRHLLYKPGNSQRHYLELSMLIQSLPRLKHNLLVDDKNGFIFCPIAKVASTTWRKLLLVLNGDANFTSTKAVTDEVAHAPELWPNSTTLRPLAVFDKTEQIKKLKTFKKVVWVRHPLLRLISAWRSKLQDKDSYYSGVLRPLIMKRYRNRTSKNDSKDGISLDEFLRFVADLVSPSSLTADDVHWSRYNAHCWPCFVNYDYIGHFEGNMKQEADYLINKLYANNLLTTHADLFPKEGARQKVNQAASIEMLATVNRNLLRRIVKRFEVDFDMFAYKIDPQWR